MKKIIAASVALIFIAAVMFYVWQKSNGCDPSNPEGKCSWQMIIDSKDKTICQRIDKEDDRTRCQDIIGLNAVRGTDKMNECLNLSKEYKKSCIYQAMRVIQDLSGCGILSGEDKQYCEDNYYFNIALKTRDISLCEKIVGSYDKQNCQEIIPRMPKEKAQ